MTHMPAGPATALTLRSQACSPNTAPESAATFVTSLSALRRIGSCGPRLPVRTHSSPRRRAAVQCEASDTADTAVLPEPVLSTPFAVSRTVAHTHSAQPRSVAAQTHDNTDGQHSLPRTVTDPNRVHKGPRSSAGRKVAEAVVAWRGMTERALLSIALDMQGSLRRGMTAMGMSTGWSPLRAFEWQNAPDALRLNAVEAEAHAAIRRRAHFARNMARSQSNVENVLKSIGAVFHGTGMGLVEGAKKAAAQGAKVVASSRKARRRAMKNSATTVAYTSSDDDINGSVNSSEDEAEGHRFTKIPLRAAFRSRTRKATATEAANECGAAGDVQSELQVAASVADGEMRQLESTASLTSAHGRHDTRATSVYARIRNGSQRKTPAPESMSIEQARAAMGNAMLGVMASPPPVLSPRALGLGAGALAVGGLFAAGPMMSSAVAIAAGVVTTSIMAGSLRASAEEIDVSRHVPGARKSRLAQHIDDVVTDFGVGETFASMPFPKVRGTTEPTHMPLFAVQGVRLDTTAADGFVGSPTVDTVRSEASPTTFADGDRAVAPPTLTFADKGGAATRRTNGVSNAHTVAPTVEEPQVIDAGAYAVLSDKPTVLTVPIVGFALDMLDGAAFVLEVTTERILRRLEACGVYVFSGSATGWQVHRTIARNHIAD